MLRKLRLYPYDRSKGVQCLHNANKVNGFHEFEMPLALAQLST